MIRQFKKRLRLILVCLGAGLSVVFGVALADDHNGVVLELPQYSKDKHHGVATCSNSSCHAVKYPDESSSIRSNEFQTWLFHDRHSKSYTTLLNDESRKIAKKLGIADPSKAAVCLDCHADNVPVSQQGQEFLMSDGVGCEACHGGSERWIGTHTVAPYDLERNLHNGMYPTHDAVARTKLCASCHVGSEKKLASHTIMGAGHPRLGFELETFMTREPRHYTVDEDYNERKGGENALISALVAQAVLAGNMATNLAGSLISSNSGYPELALFDCHACHRPMSAEKWAPQSTSQGLEPGSIRINDGHFLLVMNLLGKVDVKLQKRWRLAIRDMHLQSSRSKSGLKRAASALIALSQETSAIFQQNLPKPQDTFDMLVKMGSTDELQDYIEAEQAFMLLNVMHEGLPESLQRQTMIDQAFQLVNDETAYNSAAFRRLLRSYANQTKQ